MPAQLLRHAQFERFAPGLKSLADAVAIGKDSPAFEQAEARKTRAATGIS